MRLTARQTYAVLVAQYEWTRTERLRHGIGCGRCHANLRATVASHMGHYDAHRAPPRKDGTP